jgi:C1A family cysteine protease
MRAFVAALFLVAAFAQMSNLDNMENLRGMWSQWKIQNNKDYADSETDEMRFGIFAANWVVVQDWNADPTQTSTLALGPFADLTNEEFGAIYTGSNVAPEEVVQANLVSFDGVEIPSDWNWVTQGAVTPIKNQEQCGSCWAFATVATSEGQYFLNGNTLTSFSEQQIVDCDKTCDGCGGGWPYLAMAYVAENGLETETEYPYTGANGKCSYNKAQATNTTVTGAAFVTPKSSADLMAAVYQQPTAIIVEADQNAFQLYSKGIITTGCGVALDHAITAVGYTADYFIVKNSWGTTWGLQGYVWISTSEQYNNGLGACGLFSEPQFPKGLKGNSTAF